MYPSKLKKLLSIFIGSLLVAVAPVGCVGNVKAPIEQDFEINKAGFLFEKEFHVKTACGYRVAVYMLHEEKNLRDKDYLIKNRMFIVPLSVNIFYMKQGYPIQVFGVEKKPVLVARGLEQTTFIMGGIRLDPGKYRIKVSAVDNIQKLHNVKFRLAVEVRPKVSCG